MSMTVTAKVSRFEGAIGWTVSGLSDICVTGTIHQIHVNLEWRAQIEN